MQRAKPSIGRFVKPAFATMAGAFLVLALVRALREAKTVPTPQLGWLAAAALLFAGHYLMQAIGWHMILRGLGQPVRLRDSVRMWYATLIARWIPGPLVYSTARLVAARDAGLSVTAVAFGVLLELSYVLLGSMATTVLFAGGVLPELMATTMGRSLAIASFLALILGGSIALRPDVLIGLCHIALFRRLVRKVAGEDLPEQGLPVMGTGRSLLLLAYYSAFWVYSGVMFGVLAHAFVPMTTARWVACIPAFSGSWLAGFLAVMTPAGLGVREGIMWLMLRGSMSHADALLLPIVSRLTMLLVELLSVAVVFAATRRFARSGGPRRSAYNNPAPVRGHGQAGIPAASRTEG